MEQLLHYVWKHKLFPLGGLRTTDGRPVEVIDSGLHNHDAGPDFFNAKVKIGDTMWVGNVEIHDKASEWYLHRHHTDEHYDSVILHVVGIIDTDVQTCSGQILPQLQLDVPETVRQNYDELRKTERYPPCYQIIPSISRLAIHAYMNALQTERLEQKTEAIRRRVKLCDGSWEAACFVTLARNYGFGINSDALERWAQSVPLQCVAHHRDNLLQIEAIFMGQAGLLDPSAMSERHREAAVKDDYFVRLREEYRYLSHKFGLLPMDYSQWRFLRLRPQNFPYIRIAQLANLYYQRKMSLANLVDCHEVADAGDLLCANVTRYWETHYTFGHESPRREKRVSAASRNVLLVNTVVPMLFAYGRHKRDDSLCERAINFLEALKAEDNHIVRMWKDCGLSVENAGDSQALIQLKNEYCDKRECLRCRLGYHYLSKAKQDRP